jgi:hypothetical protein
VRGVERAERGQASVELVAAIPALLLAVLIAAQLVVVGTALWSAAGAARAGARAAHVDADPVAAALRALPGPLRAAAEVDAEGPVSVTVRSPSVLPGIPPIPVTVAAALAEGNG